MQKRQFKVVSSSRRPEIYRKWSDWKVGDIVIGTYLSNHEDQYENELNRVIRVEDAIFKDGTGDKYVGKLMCLNECGSLTEKFDKKKIQVKFGNIVQVEYMGVKKMENGPYKGKEFHDIAVDIVEEANTNFDPALDDVL